MNFADLANFTKNLSSPIQVENSFKFTECRIDERFLIKVFPSRQNCQAFTELIDSLNFRPQGWLDNVNMFDAIGIAVSQSGSVRFYTQNSQAKDVQAYYQGYKFYADGQFRLDEYILSKHSVFSSYFIPPQNLKILFSNLKERLLEESRASLIELEINNEKRHSKFIQCEDSEVSEKITSELVNSTILAYSQIEDGHNFCEKFPTFSKLNHVAFGSDDIDGTFVTFYFASELDDLLAFTTS